jgi:hypothetical protein
MYNTPNHVGHLRQQLVTTAAAATATVSTATAAYRYWYKLHKDEEINFARSSSKMLITCEVVCVCEHKAHAHVGLSRSL